MADVGIDIVVEPSGAVSGGRTAERSLDRIEASADRATKSVGRSSSAMAGLNDTAKKSNKGLRNVNSLVNQAGYQFQDFFIQIENGTPFLRAFSQQGSQLFSVINPLLGGVIGVGGALTAILIPDLLKSTDATKQLDDAIEALSDTLSVGSDGVATFTDKIVRLAQVNERAARAQVASAINQTVQALTAANNAVEESLGQFDSFFSFLGGNAVESLDTARAGLDRLDVVLGRTGLSAEELLTRTNLAATGLSTLAGFVDNLGQELGLTTGQSLSLLRAMDAFESNRSPETMQQLADAVNTVNEATDFSNEKLVALAQVVNENAVTAAQYNDVMRLLRTALEDVGMVTEQNTARFRDQRDMVLTMSQQLLVLQEQNRGNAREAAQLSAVFRSGAETGSEFAQQVALLAGQIYDAQQAQRGLNASVKDFDRDGQYIQSLRDRAELIGLTARQQAVLRAEQALSNDATATQIRQARELAAALYDAQQAARPPEEDELGQQATSFFESLIPTESLTERLEQQRALILDYQELSIGDAQKAAEALQAIDQQRWSNQVSLAGRGFGSLADLAKGFAGEQSGIYKGLFAASKAFNLAEVLLNSYGAIAKAWNSAPFPANLGPVAIATVETGALQAAVQAITPSFAHGGMAYGPGTGTSDSFTANLSNGEFVMPAQQTRQYYSDLEAMRSGVYSGAQQQQKPPQITIVNQTTGRIDSATGEWVTPDQVRVIIQEELPGQMAEQVSDPYSQFNRAGRASYDWQRSVSGG